MKLTIKPRDWFWALQAVGKRGDDGRLHADPHAWLKVLEARALEAAVDRKRAARDSGHWALIREKREEALDWFFSVWASGVIDNEKAWIEANITPKYGVPYNTFRKWVEKQRRNGAP